MVNIYKQTKTLNFKAFKGKKFLLDFKINVSKNGWKYQKDSDPKKLTISLILKRINNLVILYKKNLNIVNTVPLLLKKI